mmetsp:Transcript_50150/g.167562  ORF Transcript_50150/g.167562 Transcript_50150/m.167562 type:complete len:529 (-) Transcript_50150:176-1762(-)
MNYHVQPVCSPSRATFMSGRHVIHTGIYMPFRQGTPLRLNLSYSLLPQYLRRCCNYSSHMVGKWHLGQNVLAALPTGRGFETYLGYWSGAEDYVTHDTLGAYDFNDDARHEAGSGAVEVTLRPAVELNGTYSTAAMTARAVRVIEGFGGGGGGLGGSLPRRPLFLYLPYQAVHWPLEAPQQYVDRYRGRTGGDTRRQLVCAMAKALDDGVGQVTAALKRRGMWDESLVLFSSDNGGPTNGNEGTWSSNFPLRGGKNTLWEGGTRVVGAVRGPGIPRGAVSYEKFHATDWLPTLVAMASGRPWAASIPPGEAPYLEGDGVDNWPMLRAGGAPGSSARDWLLYEVHPGDRWAPHSHGDALVLGDLKLIRTGKVNPAEEDGWHPPPGEDTTATRYAVGERCDRSLRVGTAEAGQCAEEYCLFNVTADACEYHDLAAERPADVARLLRRLDRFRATAVPVVRPEGCEPVRVPNSRWGAGFRGVSWQPCDGPMTPPGLAEVASAGRERRGEDLFVLVRGSGGASPSGRLESVA